MRGHKGKAVLLWLLALLAGWTTSTGLLAATIQVSSTIDSPAAGTLRGAIITANSNPDADTIVFNIPGEGPHRIAVTSNLPTITAPLTIDGYSQPGALVNTLAEGSNAVIMVQVDSAIATSGGVGFLVCASDVSIRGLSITSFSDASVRYALTGGGGCPLTIDNGSLTGNFIGLRPDGTASGVVALRSVIVSGATVAIGGANNAERNVISSAFNGAILTSGAAAGTRIDGNLIGTDPSGLLDRGGGSGIQMSVGSSGVLVGGLRGNLLAFNTVGVILESQAQTGNRLEDNRYIGNAQAIDLAHDGVTANDLNDADSGPNGLQNFPVLSAAVRTPTGIGVSGTLDRPAGTGPLLYAIDVYASRSCDASGFGPGERRVGGSLVVLANGSSESFVFNLAFDEPLLAGSAITATATDSNGSTSEFSACSLLTPSNALVVTTINDSGSGSLRNAITSANANADASQIIFNIPGAGPHVIQVQSNLPTITAPLLIDGYSQPGSAANTLDDASNAVIKVKLMAAAGLGQTGTGLSVCSSKVSILGLAVTDFIAHDVAFGVDNASTACPGTVDGRLAGSFIGVNPDGTIAALLGSKSVVVRGAVAQIGGASNAERNVISSAAVAAITAQLATAGTRIDGNLIGTDPSGLQDRGTGMGINLDFGGAVLLIGTQRSNLIAFNDVGILIDGGVGNGTNVAANAFLNTGLGIDIFADGVTPNDPDDADNGPNNRQNFPDLQLAQRRSSGGLRVVGRLDVPQSAASNRYTIAVYESVACDPSGNGEGTLYLGSQDVALIDRSSGVDLEDFVVNLPGSPAVGAIVTTTATDPQGSTSEFSSCIAVVDSTQLLRNGFE